MEYDKMIAEHIFAKVLILGDSGVGKSNMLTVYTEHNFIHDSISTIGVDFVKKDVELENGNKITLQIWDTAGQEKYKSISAALYRGAKGVLFVYDITNYESFKNISKWIEDVDKYISGVPKILAGNKCDMANIRTVITEEAIMTAKKYDMLFIETSAKNNLRIDEAFNILGIYVHNHLKNCLLVADNTNLNNCKIIHVDKYGKSLCDNICVNTYGSELDIKMFDNDNDINNNDKNKNKNKNIHINKKCKC